MVVVVVRGICAMAARNLMTTTQVYDLRSIPMINQGVMFFPSLICMYRLRCRTVTCPPFAKSETSWTK